MALPLGFAIGVGAGVCIDLTLAILVIDQANNIAKNSRPVQPKYNGSTGQVVDGITSNIQQMNGNKSPQGGDLLTKLIGVGIALGGIYNYEKENSDNYVEAKQNNDNVNENANTNIDFSVLNDHPAIYTGGNESDATTTVGEVK